ncbi:hypothetical protein Vadar_018423 [Vaccinium darrowii]|uniref:Uncharacterized protein n=1 Tax=Vaccinium darrowii TaxID=229202 RepID=A0ACB7YER7_9ERIC|nr:hypothetical protein Vadar_018423 [Vaccinium darrowii]
MLLGKRPRPEFTLDLNIGEGKQPSDPFNGGAGVGGRAASADSADLSNAALFLKYCSLCKRRLFPGRDIYMYRGDMAFCSEECREEKIIQDERQDNCSFAGRGCRLEAAASSCKWPFRWEGLTTQSTAYPNPNIPVSPQKVSTEVLSENMGCSKDGRNLSASRQGFFMEGHVSESSNLTFPTCSDAAAPSQPIATIIHTSPAIPHVIPNLTGGSSETFKLGGQSTQSTAYPNHNSLVLPQPQIALTKIRSENMGSSEDCRASQQEPLEGHVYVSISSKVPTCSGPSPSQQPMPTTPYTMHRIPHVMPPLTSSQDVSSVKLKATYRDTIIEFQLPLTFGIIELKEEVALILKLEHDSFNVKYKDKEGDWSLVPCDKDLRNYLQLFSSSVNPVIRLLVVDKDANLTNFDPMALKQPATFVESGIDPDNYGIISHLLRFASKKEIYKKAGKAWTRSISSIPELKNILLSTPNRSLIAIQDIDHCAGMLPNLKNELTVSCLLKFIDGLFLRCGGERIIIFTTNHRERHDAALLSLGDMDIYIPASSTQPIALPAGGDITQLESSEQKSLVDFDATNNREYHSVVLVSSSKYNNMREASKRQCITKIVLSLVDPMIGISSTDFDAPKNGAHLARACQSGPIMSNSEKKNTGEGLNRDFLTKSVLSLDDSTKRNSLPDFDATGNKAHLLIAYQSGPVVSRLENKNCGEALKGACITKSIIGLEDLQHHSVGRRDDAVKSFSTIYDPGIHTTDSLAQKSFECCVRKEKSPYLPQLVQINAVEPRLTKLPRYSGGSFAKSASSSLWPIGLPDGRHIVVLDPLEQSTKNVAHAARVDQCSPTVSLLEKKMLRKTLKRKCRPMSVIFEIHQQHFDRKCEGSAKSFHATCISKKHGTNQVSTLKRIHKQHMIHQWPFRHKWATRKRYSAGHKRSFQVRGVSMNEKLDSRLQFIHMSQCAKADESGPTVSNSEKGSLREALKCDSLTNTRSLNDLRERFGARRKDAAKGLCDSLALKSFEVLDNLPLGEQSNCIRNLARRRTLTHKHCVRLKKSQDLQQSLLSDCSGELAAQAALGLSDGGHIPSRPEKKIMRKTLKRKSRTMSVLSLEDHQQHVGRRWEDVAKFLGAKRICRQLAIDHKPTEKRILRQHGTRRCQFKKSAIDLPDRGHILSLSKKKIVRKTLKRKCRNMSVLRSEYHQHVDSKWDDAVKSLRAKHIYRQLVIHRVSIAKRIRRQHGFHRWPFQQGYFLGGERPVDVISLSMDGKLVSRVQLIHISWLGRFSPWPPALSTGEIVGPPLALSSSQLPSTSNRAHLGGQDRSGSTTSHSQNERTRDQPESRKRKIKNLTIEDLRPYVGLTRADAARKFQMSETTFKRQCRRLKIEQWPKLPPGEEILKPPDPPGRNAGQIGMVNEFGHLPEPIEVSRPPDSRERNTGQTEGENDVVVHVHVQNHLQDYFDSPIGWFEDDSTDLQNVMQGIEVDQVIDEPLLSSAYPNPNPDVFLQPQVALTQMVSGHMGIPNNRRNSLASPAETHFEGHGAVSSNHCSNPNPDVFLQPQVALTQMVSGNMGIPNNQRNSLASPAETRLVGHGAVFSNHCLNPNPDVFLQPQVALTHMVSGNMGIPNNLRNSLASPPETRLEGHGSVSSNHCPNPNPIVFLQPQVALTHMASGHMGIPNNQRNSLSSPAETRLEGHGTVSSNQAMIQPMSTLPQMTPPSTSSEDTSSVMLKVYGLRKIIIFPFPLASGINELKGEVAMRLDLQKDSFDMNYKDDEGENIFIPLDKDLRIIDAVKTIGHLARSYAFGS